MTIENRGGTANKFENIDSTSIVKTNAGTGNVSVEALIPSANSDVDLVPGSYEIILEKKAGMVVNNTTDASNLLDTAALNQAITIDPNTTLGAGSYSIDVIRNRNYNFSNPALTTNPTTPVLEGTYTFDTKTAINGTPTSSYLSNITIDGGSSYSGNYDINISTVSLSGGTAKFNFSLTDSTGTPVPGATLDVDVTNTSGTKELQLGDVTFDINLGTLWGAASNAPSSIEVTTLSVSKQMSASNGVETNIVSLDSLSIGDNITFTMGTGTMDVVLDSAMLTVGNSFNADLVMMIVERNKLCWKY